VTEPARGLIKPLILGALTGFALVCAAFGWLERKSRPAVRNCGRHPDNECFPRCLRDV
jgi:hypothetical protein